MLKRRTSLTEIIPYWYTFPKLAWQDMNQSLFFTNKLAGCPLAYQFFIAMIKLIQITFSVLKNILSPVFYFRIISTILKSIFLFLAGNALKIGFLLIGILVISKADINLQFHFNTKDIIPNSAGQFSLGETLGDFLDFNTNSVTRMEILNTDKPLPGQAEAITAGNNYSNMTYDKKQKASSRLKEQKQLAYVNRFKSVARSEMKKFGIPASITLAQGLIESNAGESRLSKENNNHFGMKCFSTSCEEGHCANFTDDSHKDFFRKYDTAWDSFRAHSILLNGDRYRNLKTHGDDYIKWAHGLKKAGYATDKRYAEKLIHIIETLKLDQYDR